MRILNVTQTYEPFFQFGGPPVKVRALSQELARRGHQVTVLTADWGIDKLFEREKLSGEPGESSPFGWRFKRDGVEAVYLPSRARYRTMTWNPAVDRFCRERLGDSDVVHIFGLYDLLGPRVASACRSQGIPYVVEPIGMFVPIVRNLWLKRMYHSLLGHRMLTGARAIIATSEQEAADLARFVPIREKVALRRNGVEKPEAIPERGQFRRQYGIPDDARLILFLGRLSNKKSPELLLRAFRLLHSNPTPPTFHLVFAGPDEDRMARRLTEEAEKLGIASFVHILGPVFGDAKWQAYRDADLFVLPSQNENFGNSAAEAIAAGTPALVTEECGVAPLLAGRAGLVMKHDAESITSAIRRFFDEPGLGERLRAGCAEVSAGLDWGEPTSKMELLYGKLIAEAKGASFDRVS